MPTAPLRPCLEPRCPGMVVMRGRCPAHAKRYDRQRGTFRQRGYTSQWDRLAAAFKVDYPLCGMRPNRLPPVMSRCHDEGRETMAYQVDHVVPHRGDPALLWNVNNLQALCASCGAAKSQAGL